LLRQSPATSWTGAQNEPVLFSSRMETGSNAPRRNACAGHPLPSEPEELSMPDPNVKTETSGAPDRGDAASLGVMEVVEGLGRAPDKRAPPPPEEDIPDDEIKMPTILP